MVSHQVSPLSMTADAAGGLATLPPEQAERAARVAAAVHSGHMEGAEVDPATRADADGYIDGSIDADELVARTRARYGLA